MDLQHQQQELHVEPDLLFPEQLERRGGDKFQLRIEVAIGRRAL